MHYGTKAISSSSSLDWYLVSLVLYLPLALALLQKGELDSMPVVLGIALFTTDALRRMFKIANLQRWDQEKAAWNRWFIRDGSVLAFTTMIRVLVKLHIG